MKGSQGSANGKDKADTNQVVDFALEREKRLEEKRRSTERIIFQDLLSVYAVKTGNQLQAVKLLDVSEDGLGFQVPFDQEKPWPKDAEAIHLRIYFSQDTYLEVIAKVQNFKHSIDANRRFLRFGCSIDREIQAYPAYQQFVKFVKLYSEHAHKDNGKQTAFY